MRIVGRKEMKLNWKLVKKRLDKRNREAISKQSDILFSHAMTLLNWVFFDLVEIWKKKNIDSSPLLLNP